MLLVTIIWRIRESASISDFCIKDDMFLKFLSNKTQVLVKWNWKCMILLNSGNVTSSTDIVDLFFSYKVMHTETKI